MRPRRGATARPRGPRAPEGPLANFLAVIDPDRDRLERFRRDASDRLAPVPGLLTDEATAEGAWVGWAALPDAPVHVRSGGPGEVAVCWGTPREPRTGRPVSIEELGRLWRRPDAGPAPLDGFYAAFVLRGDRWVAGCDLLGTFPVYHASGGGVTVVGSSAELVSAHPLVEGRLDPLGIVGTLVWMGTVRGRTLRSGVRRLSPGRAVTAGRGLPASEVAHYGLPEGREPDGPDDRAVLQEFHDVLRGAVSRQCEGLDHPALLLSGGRDSRLLAGHLRALDQDFRPVLIPNDMDAPVTRELARALGRELVEIRPPTDGAVAHARSQARWHQLEAGFYSTHLWGLIEPLRAQGTHAVNGFLLGRIAGGWGLNPDGLADRPGLFRHLAELVSGTGVPIDTMRELLRPPLRDSVDQVLTDLEQMWTEVAEDPNERVWRLELLHADRAHIGAIPWRFSLGSWPVLPALDTELLEWTTRAPVRDLGNRGLEDRSLATHFPDLASVRFVDGAKVIAWPLRPSPLQALLRRLGWAPRGMRPTIDGTLIPRTRPYRDRHMLFDGESWRRIREAAEPYRERLHDYFDPEALARYLPAPENDLGIAERGQMGRQAMVGLMIWLGEIHG